MQGSGKQKEIDKVECLRKTNLFGGLPEPVLERVADKVIVRHLHSGQILFLEHDEARALYVMAGGRLRSVRQSSDGREQVLSNEGPGAVLAVAPVFNGGKYYSTTIADTDADVLCIPAHDLRGLCGAHPELFWSLGRLMAHKIRHYANLIETLALRNVDQRLAQYLMAICLERAVFSGKSCVLEITMTQTEMASRVGSTREVVCRALRHLEKHGLIHLKGARLLTVFDMPALAQFAGAEDELQEARLVSELSSDIA